MSMLHCLVWLTSMSQQAEASQRVERYASAMSGQNMQQVDITRKAILSTMPTTGAASANSSMNHSAKRHTPS